MERGGGQEVKNRGGKGRADKGKQRKREKKGKNAIVHLTNWRKIWRMGHSLH